MELNLNKKALYASIMESVSKIVKKTLNETMIDFKTGENLTLSFRKQIDTAYNKCNIDELINIIIIMLLDNKTYSELDSTDDVIIIGDSDLQVCTIKINNDIIRLISIFNLDIDKSDDVLILLDEYGEPITGEISLLEWKEIADFVYNSLY